MALGPKLLGESPAQAVGGILLRQRLDAHALGLAGDGVEGAHGAAQVFAFAQQLNPARIHRQAGVFVGFAGVPAKEADFLGGVGGRIHVLNRKRQL